MSNSDKNYDVVIVGGGWAGSTMAYKLGMAGKKVLILEAGDAFKSDQREEYMHNFYQAMAKVPSAPYLQNYNAPRPSVLDIPSTQEMAKEDGSQDKDCSNPISSIKKNGYFIQNGPLPFGSTNERLAGGTSWHWLGTCLRLVPNDFKLKSTYGVGVDWPMTYDELSPYYNKAEYLIGVAADKDEQMIHGITFPEKYNYPMQKIPASVLDQQFAEKLNGMPLDGSPVQVTGTPAGRNGVSNKDWQTGKPYNNGRRLCQGNTNCTPICPIQAKYDATITLSDALNTGNVDIMYKTVAYNVLMDETTKEISGIEYKQYETKKGPQTGSGTAYGKKYVIAAHAIEAAKLLLMSNSQMPSGIANSSDQVGRNLMDHPVKLGWGLMPQKSFPFRGPLSTSGIETVKDGSYRDKRAAYRIEIGNEGWNWPTGAPYTDLDKLVDNGSFGTALRQSIDDTFTRQFRIGFLIEQTPEEDSRITPSTTCTDNLGIPRPVIDYSFSDYTKAAFVAAEEATKAIFEKLGAKDYTITNREEILNNPSYGANFEYEGNTYYFFGAGHIMGTHRMGDQPTNSVTNADMKSWDHDNLFIVGCGSFPTGATSNPTLTLVALALRATDALIADLDS